MTSLNHCDTCKRIFTSEAVKIEVCGMPTPLTVCMRCYNGNMEFLRHIGTVSQFRSALRKAYEEIERTSLSDNSKG